MLRTADVAAFVSLVTFLAACGPGEPRHRGRTATSWIEELGRSHVPNEIFGRSSGEAAQEALRTIGPAAVPAGIHALAHRKWHVRVGAAHALGLYGPDAAPAVPALIEAVKDPYGAVSSMAGSALGEVGEVAIPQLAELLAHPDAAVRITAARSILHIDPHSPDAFRVLIEGLRYLDPSYRDAVDGWGADQEKWDGFIHVERDGKQIYNREHDVRAQAAQALGSLGPKRSAPSRT